MCEGRFVARERHTPGHPAARPAEPRGALVFRRFPPSPLPSHGPKVALFRLPKAKLFSIFFVARNRQPVKRWQTETSYLRNTHIGAWKPRINPSESDYYMIKLNY
jgi:hypothetical protein